MIPNETNYVHQYWMNLFVKQKRHKKNVSISKIKINNSPFPRNQNPSLKRVVMFSLVQQYTGIGGMVLQSLSLSCLCCVVWCVCGVCGGVWFYVHMCAWDATAADGNERRNQTNKLRRNSLFRIANNNE
jgi:hypothetical protein